MNILITGAAGFVGKNLTAALDNIRTEKDRTRRGIQIDRLYLYTEESDPSELEEACENADFVFHLAGVNRPKDEAEFMTGNRDFTRVLLDTLRKYQSKCPVMMASSIQASLIGRYGQSDYGRSKLEGEKLLFAYGRETGNKVLVYRFPNLFGKWCLPNYNSVVATFCHNIARNLPIQVNDPKAEIELLYIDDLVAAMLDALEGKELHCEYEGLEPIVVADGAYCYAAGAHKVTLGQIVELLERFKGHGESKVMTEIPAGSFAKKLYSTYLSYLPQEAAKFPLKMNVDERGSFTELMKTVGCGQFSVNVSKPGITKGQHWHHSKWEIFYVVSGHGLIQQRKIDTDEVIEYEVCGNHIEGVYMLPGYTHNIINLSETEPLVTVMWANEIFNPEHPDTYFEKV